MRPGPIKKMDYSSRTVRINEPNLTFATGGAHHGRRPAGFDDDDDDDDEHPNNRPSVLHRLYEDVTLEDMGPGPTLKDYQPFEEARKKNSLFLTCQLQRLNSDDEEKGKYLRHSISIDRFEKSLDRVLDIQHGKKVGRKISTDYVKTIDHIEHKKAISIRSIEFARTRPAISVDEYQKKNQQYQQEQLKNDLLLPDKKPPTGETN